MARTIFMYIGLPACASGLTVVNRTMDMAVVGPETRCEDEPKNAAMIAGTMAVYRPYSGGNPAIMAKATPCGRTMTAPVKPARMSARSVWRLINGHHSETGKDLLISALRFDTYCPLES